MNLATEKRVSNGAAHQGQFETSAVKSAREAFNRFGCHQLAQFFYRFGNAWHSVQSLDSIACQLWGR